VKPFRIGSFCSGIAAPEYGWRELAEQLGWDRQDEHDPESGVAA